MGPMATMGYEQALRDYVARTSQLPSAFLVAPPTSQLYYVLLRMDPVDQETSCRWLHPVSPLAGGGGGTSARPTPSTGLTKRRVALGSYGPCPGIAAATSTVWKQKSPERERRDAAKSPTTHKFCLAPNFNLFPQASTRAALYYLIFLLLIFCPRCAAKQLHAKEEWTYQEDSFVFGTWAVVN